MNNATLVNPADLLSADNHLMFIVEKVPTLHINPLLPNVPAHDQNYETDIMVREYQNCGLQIEINISEGPPREVIEALKTALVIVSQIESCTTLAQVAKMAGTTKKALFV